MAKVKTTDKDIAKSVARKLGRVGIDPGKVKAMQDDIFNTLTSTIESLVPSSWKASPVYFSETRTVNGEILFDIELDSRLIQRPSLYEKAYPKGAYDIVRLFTLGYQLGKGRGYRRGYWASRGLYVMPMRARRSNDSLLTALQQLNQKYQNVEIRTNKDYFQN